MRRVVVHVEEVGQPAEGWWVTVRTTDPASGATTDLAGPYPMAATSVKDSRDRLRRVPATPPDRTPAGEPHAALCTGDAEQVAALLRRIRRGRSRTDDVSVYGRWLFECLLAPAWEAIRGHPDVARQRAVELALRWPAETADLHRMVWEAMRDDTATLAGHPEAVVAITRLVPGSSQQVRGITGMPSVLFATSVELTDPTIRPGAMYMGLLHELDAAGQYRARAVTGVSSDDLHDACARSAPDLVHLVAHGVLLDNGRGALLLRGDDGTERETDAEALVAALSVGGRRPVAVALSACNTASPGDGDAGDAGPADPTDAAPLAAQLVARGIPVVSAMAGEVSESACRLYTRRLASAVHRGLPVVVASAHGRRAALIGSTSPSADIDWALPSLFLGEYVDPYQVLVDSTRARALTQLGDALGLRREPVYIGRTAILDSVDVALNQQGCATGVVAALVAGSSRRVGGTRLLREIGWRALRDGHVPLLLGPFQEARHTPTHPRALVFAILSAVVAMTEKLGVAPFVPLVLRDDLSPADERELLTTVADQAPSRARAMIHRRLREFRDDPRELIPAAVRDLLADDLAELADRVATRWGEPFGDRTRVLLLCDDVHRWAAPPLSGVGFLLDMLEDPTAGLGRSQRPSLVVFNASSTEADGKTVADWCEKARKGQRVHWMEDLTPAEMVVGYQWVLLHPWTTRSADERELFGAVYTPLRESAEEWEHNLRRLGGRPTIVEDKLYLAAEQGYGWGKLRRDDDELAWSSYVDKNPGYGL